jgi:RNA polymerase sigma-70 factor, ECF subfamily
MRINISMITIQNCAEKTDVELAGLSLENPDYFFCLLKRYEDKLLRYVIGFSGLSRDDAEDILQEVFIKTYRYLNDFDSRLKFSSWIYRIAHNHTISYLRKKNVRPSVGLEGEEAERLADEFSIVRELDGKIEREKINAILEKMDDKYREVMILRFIEGKDYVEISDILQKPVSTVGNLISRGRKIFREEYEGEH